MPNETKRSEPSVLLVVDDDAPVRRALTRLLESEGHVVLAAASVEEALELVAVDPSRVRGVILDTGLPRLSGAAAVAALRANLPESVIVLVTGQGSQRTAQFSAVPGVDAVVVKPYRAWDVLVHFDS